MTTGHAGDGALDPRMRSGFNTTTPDARWQKRNLLSHNVRKNIGAIIHRTLRDEQNMDMQGIKPWVSRMLSGSDTTTPHARCLGLIFLFISE